MSPRNVSVEPETEKFPKIVELFAAPESTFSPNVSVEFVNVALPVSVPLSSAKVPPVIVTFPESCAPETIETSPPEAIVTFPLNVAPDAIVSAFAFSNTSLLLSATVPALTTSDPAKLPIGSTNVSRPEPFFVNTASAAPEISPFSCKLPFSVLTTAFPANSTAAETVSPDIVVFVANVPPSSFNVPSPPTVVQL